MAQPLNIAVSCPCNIRGTDYVVSLDCDGNDSVIVQVEDRLSADQWRASFDAQYIEDLTHKTGNFKQFNIFVSMLESAISKTSDSVCLDLLTYNDLETLRLKKSGAASTNTAPRSSHITAKRYLILTYTVEFDRIHYPLPLPYLGKPDPQALQEEVRGPRTDLKKTRQQQVSGSNDHRMEKLLRDYRRLEREKTELEQEFAAFRREVRLSTGGNAVKDIRALKAVVRNLEEQLMREKTRYQRNTSKRSQEYRDLLEEVEELRASERNLRVRLKSLTNELAMYKRGRSTTRTNSKDRAGSGERTIATRNTSASRYRSLSNERATSRLGSAERRSSSRERPNGFHRSNSSEQISLRGSFNSNQRGRSNSFDRNNSSENRGGHLSGRSNRSRTPSPAARRFNPTAYVKEKERRLKENTLKKKREQRHNLSGLSSRSKQSPNSSRHSGYSGRLFRDDSLGSQGNTSDGYGSDGSYISRTRHGSGGSVRSRQAASLENSPAQASRPVKSNRPPTGKASVQYPYTLNLALNSMFVVKSIKTPFQQTRLTSFPHFTHSEKQGKTLNVPNVDSGEEGDSEYFDRSAEISEIDERLDRLQQLMKVAMP
ncbi:coiled-coil domain-containing protein 61 [Elysia marginata]|uniref:Centrosomal protein CCDC61 n=1 Tax=Elysia marginata TaxID=1093978 RepID=A0AAV4IVX6_9GAST|nr:coiled-coil domain-containing protein 61 [Elysia marginata]